MVKDWHDFFFAVICSTGSLLGLLFVAVSICIPKIASPELHKGSMQPLVLLLGILTASSFFLVPQQSLEALGLEVFCTGILIGGVLFNNSQYMHKAKAKHLKKEIRRKYNRFFNLVPPVLICTSGAIIYFKGAVGIYIMLPAIILSYFTTSLSAWVMLIAVHRVTDNDWLHPKTNHQEAEENS